MRTIAITLSIICAFLFASIGIAVDDETLVAYYSFDGDAEDGSGNGNTGEIKNGSKFDKGKFGDAIYLDVGAHVEMAASDTLHGDLFKSDPFTISVWINPTFEGGAWQQIWRSLPTASGHNTFFVNKDQGLLSWRGQVGGWTILCQTDGGIVKKDVWTHVAVQSDGKKFRIYANGEMAQESDFQETRGENQIYRLGGEGGEGYGGALDDAAIFSRALDEHEIKSIMKGYEEFAPVDSRGKLTTIWAKIKK